MKSHDIKNITSNQLRAARSLLNWSAVELAKRSKVGVATIRRAELAGGRIGITLANETALRQALESAGVVFIPDGEASDTGGEGVRLLERRVTE